MYLENGEQHIYIRKILNKSDDNYALLVFFEIDNIIKLKINGRYIYLHY